MMPMETKPTTELEQCELTTMEVEASMKRSDKYIVQFMQKKADVMKKKAELMETKAQLMLKIKRQMRKTKDCNKTLSELLGEKEDSAENKLESIEKEGETMELEIDFVGGKEVELMEKEVRPLERKAESLKTELMSIEKKEQFTDEYKPVSIDQRIRLLRRLSRVFHMIADFRTNLKEIYMNRSSIQLEHSKWKRRVLKAMLKLRKRNSRRTLKKLEKQLEWLEKKMPWWDCNSTQDLLKTKKKNEKAIKNRENPSQKDVELMENKVKVTDESVQIKRHSAEVVHMERQLAHADVHTSMQNSGIQEPDITVEEQITEKGYVELPTVPAKSIQKPQQRFAKLEEFPHELERKLSKCPDEEKATEREESELERILEQTVGHGSLEGIPFGSDCSSWSGTGISRPFSEGSITQRLLDMESCDLTFEGLYDSKTNSTTSRQDESYSEVCEVTVQTGDECCNTTSGDSSVSSQDGSYINRTHPIFSSEWQGSFTVVSANGATCQLMNSDVTLDIPPGAIPLQEADILVAICTDIDHIHGKLRLTDDEQIVSPLVEYKISQSLMFQKPVSISLLHGLPDNTNPVTVYVYHVFVSEDGTLEKRKLRLSSPFDGRDDSSLQITLPHAWMEPNHRILTMTNSFSGYFVCRYCNKKEHKPPILFAAITGKFGVSTTVKVDAVIWDWRLNSQDFVQEMLGKDISHSQRWPLPLMQSMQDTELWVCLQTDLHTTLTLRSDANVQTPQQKILYLQHALFCKKCGNKGHFTPLRVAWFLESTCSEVKVTIDIHHRMKEGLAAAYQPSPACTSIHSMITRENVPADPDVQTLLQRLSEMDPVRQRIVAQEIGISAQVIERVTRLGRRSSPAESSSVPNGHGAPSREEDTLVSVNSSSTRGPPPSYQLPAPVPVHSLPEEEDAAYRPGMLSSPWRGYTAASPEMPPVNDPSIDLHQQHLFSQLERHRQQGQQRAEPYVSRVYYINSAEPDMTTPGQQLDLLKL